jgi:hypothetical protein
VNASVARPFSQYRPEVGLSSSARIDRNVDFPQPDGPETDTYSPRLISSVTSDSARVSSSAASPLKTFVIPWRRTSGRLGSAGDSELGCSRRRHHAIAGLYEPVELCNATCDEWDALGRRACAYARLVKTPLACQSHTGLNSRFSVSCRNFRVLRAVMGRHGECYMRIGGRQQPKWQG